jgi:uncharacterized protein (TIGR02145 family)
MNQVKTYLSLCCLVIAITMGCKKDEKAPPPPVIPTVTTAVLTNVTTSGATAGGTIVSDGGATVTQSGIVWSKANATPTLADSVIAGTTSTGPFTTNITGLDFNTSYYIRAFATNSVGIGYGEVVTLNTTDDTNKVRFTYNGEEVVYGIIISPTTSRKWLDRNLGAKQVATAFDDYQAYGDLFQWGRPADGHQLINWTSSTAGASVNGTTTTVATSDVPGHSNFIIAPSDGSTYDDWRDNNNGDRWATMPQGPCPTGWHVPTKGEWADETSNTQGNGTATSGGITNRNTAFTLLKLSSAGRREGQPGSTAGQVKNAGIAGYYWSSSVEHSVDFGWTYGDILGFLSASAGIGPEGMISGYTIRCIKD